MTIDDIALTLQQGLGAKGAAHLMSVFGSAKAIFAASEDELVERAELKRVIAKDVVRKNYHRQAEEELRFLQKQSLSAVASTDKEYPAMLRECVDYPHVLYVRGDVEALNKRQMLSMVGTRRITPYGARMCDALIAELAELAPDTTVVSGLAFGVDAACHGAALKNGLPTVAVVANAFPGVTPARNSGLADEIVDRGGAIITELHSQTKQNGTYYNARNRIVAGMSAGLVVVESPMGGGSLSTVGFADGYERAVMAVPGRADDKCSEGNNMLIKQRKAALVCSGNDIAYELGWDDADVEGARAVKRVAPTLDLAEQRVVACFGEGETVDVEILSERSGVSAGEIAAMLLNLEISGVVRQLPGRGYELN